jgi:Glycosyl hydrolase catalytic core
MLNRLALSLLPLICLCAVACGTSAQAADAVTVGISDNGTAMFSEQPFLKLNIAQARDVVFWNAAVLKNKAPLNAARAWINAAESAGVNPLISFTSDGPHIPSVAEYTSAIRAFIHDFPQVKTYSPWNEPDWVYLPLSRNPGLAAAYFNAMVRNCKKCTILAGDLYLPAPQLGPWIRAYRKDLQSKPAVWALHPYYDVRTHTTSQIRTLESLTSGPIWLDEISGVERRGHWQYANQSVAAAGRDESFLFSLPKRFKRITRIYHYQWQAVASAPWDSGLLGPDGAPRPAYYVVAGAAGLRHATRS